MTKDVRPVVRTASLLVAACVLAGMSVVHGQSATPDPQTIVARHVEAAGGAAAFKAITSVRMSGSFELTAQGMTGTIEALSARPAKMRVTVNIAAVGRIESCYDGKHGWEIDPAQGPVVHSGRRLSEMADDAIFDSSLHEPASVSSMTGMGREDFDRRPAYKIKVVFVSGNEQIEYFDVETGLLLGYEASRVTPMGPVPITAVMRDYKKFGALLQPTVLVQRTLGLEQIVRITAIEYNTVPATAFDAPPAIKALIK